VNKKIREVLLSKIKKDRNWSIYILCMSLEDEVEGKKVLIENKYEILGNLLGKYFNEIFSDKEVVMEAVKDDGWSLEYASDRLKSDKEILELLDNL